jgi:hypothetical protein
LNGPKTKGLNSCQYKKVRVAAKDIGRLQFFEATFKVLSKFAHPTSLSVMMGRIPSDRDQAMRDIITKSGLDMAKESAKATAAFLVNSIHPPD